MSLARSVLLRASRSTWLANQFRRRSFAKRAVRRFMPGEELMEYICQENEQDSKHIQGPAQNPNENNPLTGRTVR